MDEDYRFVLEVRLKNFEGRTRVLVKASPMYRIRDWEKEDERDTDASGSTTVDLKIKAPEGAAVSVEPGIFIAPLVGTSAEYRVDPLPDAADRAQKLVRSFLYFLDQRLAGADIQK